jgi:hypothetical protein
MVSNQRFSQLVCSYLAYPISTVFLSFFFLLILSVSLLIVVVVS